MPLNSSIVGLRGDSLTSEIDARWTMAYAAALGDVLPCYLDTLSRHGIVAHPMFPVCFEWAVILAMRAAFEKSGLTPEEARRGVHASHDLLIHRPIHPPERLHSHATFAGVERRKPGAYQLTRIETVDDRGEQVCTSWYGSIYRDVSIEGPDRMPEDVPTAAIGNRSGQPVPESTIPVSAGLAHTYTECARIFNPIHTDAAVARSAGLPEIILHGTATLALAVSKIVATEANGDPLRVRRIAGRFGAMVLMPSNITLRTCGQERDIDGSRILFDVLNAQQGPAIRDGFVVLS